MSRIVETAFAAVSICLTLSFGAQSAEPPLASDVSLLARWIAEQQYRDPSLPSYGGIKVHPSAAVVGADGARYCRVSPYFANLGVLGLLRAKTPDSPHVAELWVRWYFAHLDPQDAPAGVPDEYFYQADGRGETTCVKPGDRLLCHYNDATDSAAATFFSVLWAAHQAGVPDTTFNTPERRKMVGALATVLLKLQQPDGLCWAKSDYRVKYLEDNCEVFAGLRDLASFEQAVFNDAKQSVVCQQAADRVQQGIFSQLFDPKTKLYAVAKFADGHRQFANLDKWYPDTQAQFWPQLFGVVAPTDPKSLAVMAAVNGRWNGSAKPDWAAHPEKINGGSIEAGAAYAALLAGETGRVRTYVHAVKRLNFPQSAGSPGFAWPFDVADAGWLLQTLVQLEGPPTDK